MTQNKLAKIICLVGIIGGILIIILGISVLDSFSGSWSDTYTSFGADFYTYSYKATARAGNNVDALGDMLETALGYLIIAMGIFDSCYFGLKFASIPAEPKAVPTYVPQDIPVPTEQEIPVPVEEDAPEANAEEAEEAAE